MGALLLCLAASWARAEAAGPAPASVAVATSAAADDPAAVVVNGRAIRRSEILERLWRTHAQSTLAAMVDDLLVRQAAEEMGIGPDPGEAERRLEEIRASHPDEAAFLESLRRGGATLEGLRGEIAEDLVREAVVVRRGRLGVTEAEAREHFERHRREYAEPERVRLLDLRVSTLQEAKDALMRLKAGADFRALAKSGSSDPSRVRGGDLGWVARGRLQPKIEEKAFSLKPGETGIVRTEKGWHVLQVVEKRPARRGEFDGLRDSVRRELLRKKAEEAAPAVIRELRERAVIELR